MSLTIADLLREAEANGLPLNTPINARIEHTCIPIRKFTGYLPDHYSRSSEPRMEIMLDEDTIQNLIQSRAQGALSEMAQAILKQKPA